MMTSRFARIAITASVMLFAAPIGAQAPWDKVPAFPKACYSNADAFEADVDKAMESIDATIQKQTEINDGLKAKLDEMDDMQKQSRMMAFLQKDPAAAQKSLQAIAGGLQPGAGRPDLVAKRQALADKLAAIQAQYDADLAKFEPLMAPLRDERRGQADLNRARAAATQYNAEYEKLCVKWWTSSTNPFVGYLVELKRHLAGEQIPSHAEDERNFTLQYEIFGIPHAAFRTPRDLETVKQYLQEARQIFGQRRTQPLVTW